MFTVCYRVVRRSHLNFCSLPYEQMSSCYNSSGCDPYNRASYLAGLIEGGGHITVDDYKNSDNNVRVRRPTISIAFHVQDKPLVYKLSALFKVGVVVHVPQLACIILVISDEDEVLEVLNLINGRMRTSKIEDLHRAISRVNEMDGRSIPKLGLDTSPLDSNS